METMKATALHPSEKKSITSEVTCTGSEKNEGENKEDQLLSGTGKDRNAEDPVSKGSVHLRVSDVDEAQQDGVSVLANLDKKGTETTDQVTEVPVESAAGRESSKSNEVGKIEEVKKSFRDKSSVANSVKLTQEAQQSGNFSVDKKMGDRQLYDADKKSTSADTTDYKGSSCINNSYLPTKRSVRGNRWSYPNEMHNLSFYNGRIETLRYQYRLKKKRLFSESSPYNTRYYNVLPHARNRGLGRRNPYYNGKQAPVGKIKNVENPTNAQSPLTESQEKLNKDTACRDMSKSLPINVKSEEEENKFVIDEVTDDDSAGTAKSVAAAQSKSPDERNEDFCDVDKKPKDCENDGGTSEKKSAEDSNVDAAPPVSSEELKSKPEEDAKEAVKINEIVDNNCAVNNDDKEDINVNSTTENSKDVFNSQNFKTDKFISNVTAVESNCNRELTQTVNVDCQIVPNEVNATSDICTKVNDTSAKTTDAQNIENASNASQEKTDEATKNLQTADRAVSGLPADCEGNEKQGSSVETNKDLCESSQEILHAEDANAKTSDKESCDKEDKKIEASDSKEVVNGKVVPAITNGVEDIEKSEDVEKSEGASLSDASIGGAKGKLDVSTSDVELITEKPENAIAMGNDGNNANDVLSKKIESSDSNIFEKKDNVVVLENDVLSDTDKNDLETGSTKSTDSLIEIQTDGSSVQTTVKNVTNKKRRKRKRPKRRGASRRKLTVPEEKSVSKTATTNSVKKYDKQVNTRGDKKSVDTENITVDLTGEELFETVTKNSKNTATDKSKKVPSAIGRNSRKRTLQMLVAVQENEVQEKKKEQENSRQRRRIARNAEAIIRKELLGSNSDFELISEMDKNVADKKKTSDDTKTSVEAGRSSLKRLLQDNNEIGVEISVKKPRMSNEIRKSTDKDQSAQIIEDPIKSLNYVRKFYQRDAKERLAKLTQTELEELLIQKIVETIAMRGEIGKLREQAKISERNQEATRVRCVHLARQIKDLELVLNHSISERRSNNEKIVAPIKINRSVGLQVNFTTDGTIHNLRQLQQTMALKSAFLPNGTITQVPEPTETPVTINSVPRRGLKVRSPRRIDVSSSMPVTPVQSQTQTTQPAVSSVATPTALIVGKSSDSVHCINNFSEVATTASSLPKVNNSSHTATPRSVVLNGKLPSPVNRQVATGNFKKTATKNDLIDLTDEEEKSKSVRVTQNTAKTAAIEPEVTIASKSQTRYQKVLPAPQVLPANVAVTTQQNNIRLMTPPTNTPTPTALMNNMQNTAPRVTYFMHGTGQTRQIVLAPNPAQVRQSSPNTKGPVSSVTYKTGVTHLENGMRLITTPSLPNIHLIKHPAPLPDVRNNPSNPSWKLPPPAPSLKITKVLNGIVLSWNMNLSDQYAKIVSYQLYAYQEFPNVVPSSNLWKKVGDVRALQLPMACTLTQFSEGNNYHFAVRAVDAHSRLGQYSLPGNISL